MVKDRQTAGSVPLPVHNLDLDAQKLEQAAEL